VIESQAAFKLEDEMKDKKAESRIMADGSFFVGNEDGHLWTMHADMAKEGPLYHWQALISKCPWWNEDIQCALEAWWNDNFGSELG